VLLDALSPVELLVARAAAMFRGEVPPSAPAALIGLDAEAARTVIEALVNRSIVQRQGAGLLVPAPAREVLRGLSRRDPDHAQWRARLDRWLEGFLDGELAQVGTEGGPALDRLGARWLDLDPILDLPADADPACILRLCAVAREAAERTSRHRRDRWVQSLQHQTDRPDLSAGLRARVLQATHALSWERMARSRRVETLQVALDLATAAREPVLRAAIAGELASVVAFAEGAPAARGLLDDAPMPPDAPVDERVRRMRHEGRLAGIGGDPRAGLQTLRDAVDLAFQHGLPILEARCLVAYGQALSASDPSPDAAPLLRRAVRLCDEHGLAEQGIRALIRLAQHLLRRGEREEARALLDASRERATVGGWTVLLEQSVTALGFLLIGEGRVDEAVAELDLAHTLCAELGGGRAMYVALCNRGLAHALGGHKVDSLADLRAAVALPGGPGGWLRALGLAYLTVAEALAEPAREPPALAPTQDALALVDHPARGALDDALRRLRAGPDGRTDTLAWARSWQGPGEVELVVRAVASWAASDSVTI
jgi:tetratricopeptide (TPR) repeat protein